jgi:hypothetical protein
MIPRCVHTLHALTVAVVQADPALRAALQRGTQASDAEFLALSSEARNGIRLLKFLERLEEHADVVEALVEGDPLPVEPEGPLAGDYPALDRWRRAVLEGVPVPPQLARAAAWELTAVECERCGDPARALDARRTARAVLLHHHHHAA